MPRDSLQIALEHHRAGRLVAAEREYRALLGREPDNADAAHWLGVLILQAGKPMQALPLLQQAARARPHDPAFINNLAEALLACGRCDEALANFGRAMELAPRQPQPVLGAARAHLARRQAGDIEQVIGLLQRAKTMGVNTPELHRQLGLALLLSGNVNTAIAEFREAIALKPDDAEAYYHLAAAARQQQDTEAARSCLALALKLNDKHAPTCYALAVLESEAGQWAKAEQYFRQAVALKPDSPAAREGLAAALRQLGKSDSAGPPDHAAVGKLAATESEAIAQLQERLTPSAEMERLYFQIASRFNIPPPLGMPADSVRRLFDKYAPQFDRHLQEKLNYQLPRLIGHAIGQTRPAKPLEILDLGCGTGLCGQELRPFAARLSGVDLSPAMVEESRKRGIYDELRIGDLVETMRAAPQTFDLLVAADVLGYLGDLTQVFDAAHGALRQGGLFVFSVEAGGAKEFELQKGKQRYAHSKAYIERLAAMFGFIERSIDTISPRIEANQPVYAYLAVLERPT